MLLDNWKLQWIFTWMRQKKNICSFIHQMLGHIKFSIDYFSKYSVYLCVYTVYTYYTQSVPVLFSIQCCVHMLIKEKKFFWTDSVLLLGSGFFMQKILFLILIIWLLLFCKCISLFNLFCYICLCMYIFVSFIYI